MSKKLLIIGLIAAFATSCNNSDDDNTLVVEPEKVVLSTSSLSLNTGDTVTITAYVTNISSQPTISWNSSNDEVAIVDEGGLIKVIAAGSATISASYSTSSADCSVTVSPSVYIVGSQQDSSGNSIGVVWRGVEQLDTLSCSGGNVYGNGIWVGQGNVYALFDKEQSGSNIQGVVEKNGQQLYSLSNSSYGYTTSAITIYNTYVYSATTQISNTTTSSVYWENENAVTLTEASANGQINDIFVLSSGIYSVGSVIGSAGYYVATLWKGSSETQLADITDNSIAYGVFVENGAVYSVGSLEQKPVLWSGDSTIYLYSKGYDGVAQSVYVDQSDIYICGFIKNSLDENNPVYWKNGSLTMLSDSTVIGSANAIMVVDDTNYICGTIYDGDEQKGVIWVDEQESVLSSDSSKSSATDLYIR